VPKLWRAAARRTRQEGKKAEKTETLYGYKRGGDVKAVSHAAPEAAKIGRADANTAPAPASVTAARDAAESIEFLLMPWKPHAGWALVVRAAANFRDFFAAARLRAECL
jgi:hypothetical protein